MVFNGVQLEIKEFPWQALMRQWIGDRTTRDAGRVLGLSHTAVQRYLRGEGRPSLRKARRLSRRMGISYELILSVVINDRREHALADWGDHAH